MSLVAVKAPVQKCYKSKILAKWLSYMKMNVLFFYKLILFIFFRKNPTNVHYAPSLSQPPATSNLTCTCTAALGPTSAISAREVSPSTPTSRTTYSFTQVCQPTHISYYEPLQTGLLFYWVIHCHKPYHPKGIHPKDTHLMWNSKLSIRLLTVIFASGDSPNCFDGFLSTSYFSVKVCQLTTYICYCETTNY